MHRPRIPLAEVLFHLLPFIVAALLVVGCTAEQLARSNQISQDMAAGRPIVVSVPYPSATQPTDVSVPSGAIPYHEIIGLIGILGTAIIGAYVHKSGVTQGQDTQTVTPAPTTQK